MGKLYKILSLTAVLVLLTGCSALLTDYDVLPDPTQTAQPTVTPLSTYTPNPTPEPLIYWPDGVKVVDITDSTSRSCTFDMCVFLKLTALKTCSSISIDGTTYTADDEEFDSFSDDFPRLKKGASRIVEFGTDATDDSEDYVEMDSATCWK
jgi:hypothetical protein